MTDRMESAKLQELLGKITQGNWRAEALGVTSDILHGMDEICSASGQTKDPESDMMLMAEAARLAAEVLEARAALAELRGGFDRMAALCFNAQEKWSDAIDARQSALRDLEDEKALSDRLDRALGRYGHEVDVEPRASYQKKRGL